MNEDLKDQYEVKEFLKEVVDHRKKYAIVKFRRSDIGLIQKLVIEILGLQSLNNLRDKFEGVAFYNNYSNQLLGELAVEKYLGSNFVPWDKLKENILREQYFKIDQQPVDIITAQYGEFPAIGFSPENPAIINIRKDELTIWICGFASKRLLLEYSRARKNSQVALNKEKEFFGFSALKQFKSIDEIKLLNI